MTARQKRILRNSVRAVLYPLLALCLYAFLIEPNWLRVNEFDLTDLPLESPSIASRSVLPQPLPAPAHERPVPVRLVQMTDLHIDGRLGLWRTQSAAAKAAELRPDLIVLTGDFFSGHIYNRPATLAALRLLPALAPTYAVAGNHDGGKWVAYFGGFASTAELSALLQESGIVLLENSAARLELHGRRIELYGSGDPWAGNCEAAEPQTYRYGDGYERIVLTHNADARTTFNLYPWKLMLSGHTHGGQVVLPIYGPLILPVSDRSRAAGLFREPSRATVVSVGVGSIKNVRFNCRPEIVLIRF